MNITLNGKPHVLDASLSVAALVERLGVGAAQVAVERNLKIVPRSKWAEAMVAENDAIEIVRFIGGG